MQWKELLARYWRTKKQNESGVVVMVWHGAAPNPGTDWGVKEKRQNDLNSEGCGVGPSD